MKRVITTLLTGTALFMSSLVSAESPHEFSANVALSTNYMYRGGSQTDNGPAISGGFDYGHASGFYLGTWASNVDFSGQLGATSTNIEIDIYGGVAGEFSNGISWDLGGLYYWYPGTDDFDETNNIGGNPDFFEVYGSLGYTFGGDLEPSVGVFMAYTPDYFGEIGDGFYVAGDFGISLPHGFSLAAQIGHQDLEESNGGVDYSHYSIGLSKDIGIFTLDGSWYDSLDDADVWWGGDNYVEALVFTVSSSF